MSKINFDLKNASPEFRKGFLAALDFMDGVETTGTISHDFTSEDMRHTGITIPDSLDNRTFRVMRGKIRIDSIGVER